MHFCLICSVRYTSFSISLILLRSSVFLCQFIHCDALLLGPANFELRITKNWISLETIVNSIKILFHTSATKCSFCASVLPCRVPRGRPFLMTEFGIEKTPVAIGENCGWIRFQLRDVHKCNRLLLDSNKEGILSIALSELFRIAQTTQHCPFHESSPSIRH